MAQFNVLQPWAGDRGSAFDALRREMDTLFGRFDSDDLSGRRGVYPAANLYETGDGYVLTAELPGVDPADLEVSIEGTTLTLGGRREIAYPSDDASLHRRERQSGRFRRAFELPVAVDAEKVEAVHKHGVLMLRLPKAPEFKPRQIAVQAG